MPAFASKTSTTSYTALSPSTVQARQRTSKQHNTQSPASKQQAKTHARHKSQCPRHSLTQQRTGTTRKQSQSLRWQRRCTETTPCDAQLGRVPCARIRLHERGSRSRGVSIPLLPLLAMTLVALERSVRRICSCSVHRAQKHGSQDEQRKRRDASHQGMRNVMPHCV